MGVSSYTVFARFGTSSAQWTIWTSDSAVSGHVSRGIVSTLPAAVTVGLSIDSVSSAVSYDGPLIRAVFSGSPHVRTYLSFSGVGYGDLGHTISARFSGSACETTLWMADTVVRCTTRIERAKLPTSNVLTVGQVVGTWSGATSFSVLEISSVSPTNAPTAGHKVVLIAGSAYGAFDASPRARVHASVCENTLWSSDTLIFCKVGAGSSGFDPLATVRATVSRDMQTLSNAVSFDGP
eukprot:2300154-Rhodomonas_salina.1